MKTTFSRRDFLKLGAFGLGSLAFHPLLSTEPTISTGMVARVATTRVNPDGTLSVSVYSQPNDKSQIICQRYRDELVNIYYEVISPDGPYYNPKWYRVWNGYMHSASLQIVSTRLNPVILDIPANGFLGEVTVPMTQTMRLMNKTDWEPVYRLYYGSTHWIVGIDNGPDGEPWYRLKDELTKVEYNVSAPHLRQVTAEELTPLSPDIPVSQKRIEVSLSEQTLRAYESDKLVLQTKISSGNAGLNPNHIGIPTSTPTGTFHIEVKVPSKHMGDGITTASLAAYELPGVPWVSFFVPDIGIALHGTYWHDNFGLPMSHGCVNMRTEDAKWIYRWTTPVIKVDQDHQGGFGTTVTVV
jgi:lipoprotein-anchoring transpeptidase ErfK/SrfK